jgi:hypothetical protein
VTRSTATDIGLDGQLSVRDMHTISVLVGGKKALEKSHGKEGTRKKARKEGTGKRHR